MKMWQSIVAAALALAPVGCDRDRPDRVASRETGAQKPAEGFGELTVD